MAFSFTDMTKLANMTLDTYFKTKPTFQNVEQRPLMAALESKKKTFPAGKEYISVPVQGKFLSDNSSFYDWVSHTDTLTFARADDIDRAQWQWRQWHAGEVCDFTDLMQNGIVIDFSGKKVTPTKSEAQIIENWFSTTFIDNFNESLERKQNESLWGNGTQDSKAVVGITGILDDDPTTGTLGGLDRATYTWWRHRVKLDCGYSKQDQTLTNTLKREVRQLVRFGGKPKLWLAGSDFMDAIETETDGKISYSVTGNKDVELQSGDIIPVRGVGGIKYDPWLDNNGYSKRCYAIDTDHCRLMSMEGYDTKPLDANRPHDQLVMLKSVIGTTAIVFNQMNCHGVYAIA